MYIYWSVTNR